MGDTVIGLLHPGEMGAAVAACLTARGHGVRWVSDGRGPATAARAAQAGLVRRILPPGASNWPRGAASLIRGHTNGHRTSRLAGFRDRLA